MHQEDLYQRTRLKTMKPYGLSKIEAGDLDCGGCAAAGRATRTHNLKAREYHSLRNGKRAKTRRYFKRRERMNVKQGLSAEWDRSFES